MIDILVILVLLLVVGGAGLYVYRAKKAGHKCIGCPAARTCSGQCGGCPSQCGKANQS